MYRGYVLITGATGLLGREFSRYFASIGLDLIITGRTEKTLTLLKDKLKQEFPVDIKTYCFDHSIEGAAEYIVMSMRNDNCMPSFIINNVRDISNVSVNDGDLPSDVQWHNCFQLNVVFPFQVAMMVQKYKVINSVVNVSSIYGTVAHNSTLYENGQYPFHYGVIKAAQNQLTKEMAILFSQNSTIVNGICYCGIEGRVDENFKSKYKLLCPKGRMLKVNEILDTAKYLLLDANPMVTGQIINVAGGWELW